MFLFIPKSLAGCKACLRIQIHLMFLFILITAVTNGLSVDSNTSHVLIYHSVNRFYFWYCIIQIHLMFLFIDNWLSNFIIIFKIQIHLMFLFIVSTNLLPLFCSSIQIHLMFLFIPFLCILHLELFLFKYISCSYLSIIDLIIVGLHCHSNTSHVLIYSFLFSTNC